MKTISWILALGFALSPAPSAQAQTTRSHEPGEGLALARARSMEQDNEDEDEDRRRSRRVKRAADRRAETFSDDDDLGRPSSNPMMGSAVSALAAGAAAEIIALVGCPVASLTSLLGASALGILGIPVAVAGSAMGGLLGDIAARKKVNFMNVLGATFGGGLSGAVAFLASTVFVWVLGLPAMFVLIYLGGEYGVLLAFPLLGLLTLTLFGIAAGVTAGGAAGGYFFASRNHGDEGASRGSSY